MSTARYLLDTNICIYVQRRQPRAVQERLQRLRPGEAAISVITYGELLFGAEKSSSRARVLDILDEFVGIVPVLPLSADIRQYYGVIRGTLERQGQPIGSNDTWIAAHAKAMDLILVTNNEREFRRVAGLTVENWIV